MKKILGFTLAIVLGLGLFVGGALAGSNWLNFNGAEQATTTEDNIDEIMSILNKVNDGKLSAEQAFEDLQGVSQDKIDDLQAKLDKKHEDYLAKHEELLKKQAELVVKQEELNKIKHELDNLIVKNQENQQYIEHLEAGLIKANETVSNTFDKSVDALERAREYEGN